MLGDCLPIFMSLSFSFLKHTLRIETLKLSLNSEVFEVDFANSNSGSINNYLKSILGQSRSGRFDFLSWWVQDIIWDDHF